MLDRLGQLSHQFGLPRAGHGQGIVGLQYRLSSLDADYAKKPTSIRRDHDPEHYAFSYDLYGKGPDKEDDSNG